MRPAEHDGRGADAQGGANGSAGISEALVGGGVLALGLALAVGAVSISSAAGYGGVGPNFLPWVVAVVLMACGVLIIREALAGGVAAGSETAERARPRWAGGVWVSAGLLSNAALITSLGFILSCGVCYLLAVQGLRRAQGQAASRPATLLADALTGLAVAAPVYWAFTQLLGLNLPGLTHTGWL